MPDIVPSAPPPVGNVDSGGSAATCPMLDETMCRERESS
jgi:hypothetical protein